MSEKKSSVFISHSSRDDDFVRWLAAELDRHGIEIWVDQRHLKPGDSVHGKIGDGLEKADRFIIVLSEAAVASNWVNQELTIALTREKREDRHMIIPVLLEQISKMSIYLEDKKNVDFKSRTRRKESLKELLSAFGIEFQESTETKENKPAARLYPNHFLPELKFFVGREELLKQIKETLDKNHRAAIHDISGLGKTFTTYKFVQDNQGNYDHIFFIRATREEMLESLAKCGEMVDPGLAEVTEQQAKALGFKQWLEENEKWLVIYDNVDLPDELFKYVPVSKKGDCILTSNFKEVVSLVTKNAEIKIEKLDKKDAGILLYSRAENRPFSEPEFDKEEDQTAFNNLIEEIEGLPLTLNSTGAFISREDVTFAEFWERFKATPDVVWDSEDKFSTYENRQQSKSAGKVFSLVYDELCKVEGTGEAVKAILDAASFISPDEIPSELLLEILKSRYAPFAEMETPDGFWDKVRKSLTAYDILKYDKNRKTFITHRAIQRVIQSRLKGEEKDICTALASVLRGLFPMYDYSNREVCEKYYQHVLALLENADKFGAETKNTTDLYFMLGRYQNLMGNYEAAEKFHLRAAEISAKVLGDESESYATDLNDLAGIYWSQGRYNEAIKKYEEAIRIGEKTIGRKHPAYAARLNNLGLVYKAQGKYDEAIEKFEEAKQITENSVGREHPAYAIRLNNLGLVYGAQGRHDEAIEKFEEALLIGEKTVGCEHPNYAIRLNNLALVYEALGKFQEALDLYKNALRIFEKTLPDGHPYITELRESVERCAKSLESS